jgi:outer membrane lipase/esterase
MRTVTAIVNIAVLALLAQPAAAHVWVFGDSNVDTGWYKVSPFSGNQKFDFDLAMSSAFDIGKPTNNPGPMSVEVLAGLLRTTAQPANQGGTNYATSGAKNVNANTPLNGGFPKAIPTATQISNYISQHGREHGAAHHALFVVDSGANDIGFALGNLSGFTSAQQTAYIEAQATALAQAIKDLQHHGAKHVVVIGQPESFGDAEFQAARQLYDTTLRNALDAAHVRHAWADANQVRKDIVANPATFNIQFFTTAAGQTACPLPDPVLNITTAWALLCSAQSPVTQPTAFADQTLFADDQHWSASAQKVLGSYLFCLTRHTWPHLVREPHVSPPFACSDFSEFKRADAPAAAE